MSPLVLYIYNEDIFTLIDDCITECTYCYHKHDIAFIQSIRAINNNLAKVLKSCEKYSYSKKEGFVVIHQIRLYCSTSFKDHLIHDQIYGIIFSIDIITLVVLSLYVYMYTCKY